MRNGATAPAPAMAAVLDTIRDRVTVSRVELAETTGLNAATVTHTVRRLMDVGYVREVGTARSRGGSPRRLIQLEPSACYTVGVQFDRFTTTAVVVDLSGEVVGRSTAPGAGTRAPGEVLRSVDEQVRALLSSSAVSTSQVLGIGVTTHGPQDRDAGVVLIDFPSPPWRGYPLTATLSELSGLPVVLENDATAAAIGIAGLGSSGSSFATVYMSGGIGSGVVLSGQPYRGATSNGVELGHISIDASGERCTCGNVGCVENSAGPTAVVEQSLAVPGLAKRAGIRGKGDTLGDFRRLGAAALGGDGDARKLIERSAALVAVASVTLVNLFDVAHVVFAGAAFTEVGEIYREHAQRELERAAFMRSAHPVSAELSERVSEAAAIGGAVVVLRSLVASRGEFAQPATSTVTGVARR
ncbi:ROK family transcriptional regulator [Rathayibacter sp. CAU 1779]